MPGSSHVYMWHTKMMQTMTGWRNRIFNITRTVRCGLRVVFGVNIVGKHNKLNSFIQLLTSKNVMLKNILQSGTNELKVLNFHNYTIFGLPQFELSLNQPKEHFKSQTNQPNTLVPAYLGVQNAHEGMRWCCERWWCRRPDIDEI